MLDAKLSSDPAQTFEERKRVLKDKLNNLVLAAVGVFGEAGDRTDYARMIRGIINNACELGGEFERDTRNPDSKEAVRPNQEAPAPEAKKADQVDPNAAKAKAKEAAQKL
jgi:hypothetical protein